jgi:serine O-acetyltransferase
MVSLNTNRHIRKMCFQLRSDYRRHLESYGYPSADQTGSLGKLLAFLRSPGFFAVLVHRLMHLGDTGYHGKRCLLMRYYIRLVLCPFNYLRKTLMKIEIPKSLSIGPGLVLSSRGEIVVGAECIGENCTLDHKVTIGVGGPKREKPIIGDNVRVESGALIFGGIRIGNNVTIKAGTVCSKNIPDNCTVEGNPARIVKLL